MSGHPFQFPVDIRLNDIDAAGVMFFAQYFHFAHDAYEAFMSEIGFPLHELIRRKTLLPLVHSEADYLEPLHHGDRLNIILGIEHIGTSSFSVQYRFINSRDQVAARLKTTHVMLNPQDLRPMELPAALRERLSQYTLEAPDD